jgi:hypothetical protein
MNHQPFESWLLSEDALDEDQARSLRKHLENCDQCSSLEASWNDVHRLFEITPQVTPAPGFSARWQARLEGQQRKRHLYQSWILFAGTAGSAAVLLILLCLQALPILRTPENLLLFLIYRLVSLVAYVQTAQNLVWSLFGTIADLVPPPVWIGLFGTFSMFCVLWFVLLRQLSYSRRINL